MTAARTWNPDRARIDEEASAWVVLASERELTQAEQRDLDAWRAADPRNEAAWRELGRSWGEIPEMRHLGALAPLDEGLKPRQRFSLSTSGRRRLSITALGAIAAALFLAIMVPGGWLGQTEKYATELAHTRLITLPDGSQVTLGPRSTLAVQFSDRERRVALTGGEAFFEVVHDGKRPFLVEAGASLVRAVGTKFDVNYSQQSLRVSVLQGLVEVRGHAKAKAALPTPQLLREGQRTEIVLDDQPIVHTAPAMAPGAWREGRLVYDNVRLADLVADVNRYYAPGVTFSDQAVGDLRVTVSFKASEIPAFLSVLDSVVPIKTLEMSDGAFRLEPARN